MNPAPKFKRGETSPDQPGMVFQAYKHGMEYWVTPEQAEKNRLDAVAYSTRRRKLPEVKERMRQYNQRPERKAFMFEYQRQWRADNRDEVNEKQRERLSRPEQKAKHQANYVRWASTDQGQANRRAAQIKLRSTPDGKIISCARGRISSALKRGGTKSASTLALLGCSIPEFRAHLQKQFRDGMNWNNHGEWEIDHIRPLAAFNLTDPAEQRKAFHFTNCQPLWRLENIIKNDRIPGELFRGRHLRKLIAA